MLKYRLLKLLAVFALLHASTGIPHTASQGPGANSESEASITDGLVAYYSFDGGTAADDSGNGHHGTIHGNPEVIDGVSGGAFWFDGVDDYIQVDLVSSLLFNPNIDSFSLTAWAKPVRANDTDGPVGCDLWCVPLLDAYRYYLTNDAIEGKRDSHAQGGARIEDPVWDAEHWHCFAGVWSVEGDKAHAYYYVDGVLRAQNTLDVVPGGSYDWHGLYIGATQHCTAGGRRSFGEFSGDELRIYDRALSSDEIQTLCPVPFEAFLPLVARSYVPPVTFPLHIGDAIPVRPVAYRGEVFYTRSVRLPDEIPSDGHFHFSSESDAVAEALVDDELAVLSDGTEVFAYDFSTSGSPVPAIVEMPGATVEQLAGQTVTIEYRDVYSSVVEASPMWLIWTP